MFRSLSIAHGGLVVTRCHVKGNYYKNNIIRVSEKKILEKYVVEKYENTEIQGTCCNDCYGWLDNNSKLSCVIFVSSHIAKIKFLGQEKNLMYCWHVSYTLNGKKSQTADWGHYFCIHLCSKPWKYQHVADSFQCYMSPQFDYFKTGKNHIWNTWNIKRKFKLNNFNFDNVSASDNISVWGTFICKLTQNENWIFPPVLLMWYNL